MAQAAYLTTIKRGGTPTTFTDEATTNTSGFSYRINTATKRILDILTPPTVKVNTVTVTSGYTVNYLTGVVTFGSSPGGTVTVSGKYMPLVDVAGANKYELSLLGDVIDATTFTSAAANGGFRSREYGINDVSLTLARFDDFSGVFRDVLEAREKILVEIGPANGAEKIRGWFVPELANASGDLSALEGEELTFQLAADEKTSFYWGA